MLVKAVTGYSIGVYLTMRYKVETNHLQYSCRYKKLDITMNLVRVLVYLEVA